MFFLHSPFGKSPVFGLESELLPIFRRRYISIHSPALCFPAFLCLWLSAPVPLHAQNAAAPSEKPSQTEPDVLLFNNGEKLIGHLERAEGTSVLFKSDMAGEIKVDVGKIKELHSSRKFAVIGKNILLKKHENQSRIPQGPIAISDGKVTVNTPSPAPPPVIPVANTSYIIDEQTFTKNLLSRPGIFQNWKGSATAGVSLVLATQKSRTITSAVSLIRTVPTEDWLQRDSRTTLNFYSAYGALSEPGSPTIKTSLYHADVERDEYFSPRLYYFFSGSWDHNISQGLDLQQTYGAGIGWTVIKDPNQELNLRVSLDYINQRFNPILIRQATGNNPSGSLAPYSMSLVGSVFGETYNRKLPKTILLNQYLTLIPAWNNLNAYSANAGINITLPVYRRLGITIGTIDTFLNNPPPGFQKNSFQFTAGATYTLP